MSKSVSQNSVLGSSQEDAAFLLIQVNTQGLTEKSVVKEPFYISDHNASS